MWPCRGSKNCQTLVEIRGIFLKYIIYVHEKIHAIVHIRFENITLISIIKNALVLVQIDQTLVHGDRKRPIRTQRKKHKK